jgi:hypothetical protein
LPKNNDTAILPNSPLSNFEIEEWLSATLKDAESLDLPGVITKPEFK